MSRRDELLRQIQRLRQRIKEHEAALEDYQKSGGYTSSVEREIRAFCDELSIAESKLNGHQYKKCNHCDAMRDFLNNKCDECGNNDW